MAVAIIFIFLVIPWMAFGFMSLAFQRRMLDIEFKSSIRSKLLTIKILMEILEIVKRLEAAATPIVAAGIEFYTLVDGKLKKVEHMFLKVSQSLPLSLAIKDKAGNPAQVDGAPKWASSDESLAVLEVAADGMSAVVKPVGPVGSVKVQVSADADLGEGVKALLGELQVDLLPGEAVALEIAAGAPVDL